MFLAPHSESKSSDPDAEDTWSMPPSISPVDPVNRLVEFRPSKEPYDPRHMLAGTTDNGDLIDYGINKHGWKMKELN